MNFTVRRWWLFFGIVWRDYYGVRLSIRTAWDVAVLVWPKGEKR